MSAGRPSRTELAEAARRRRDALVEVLQIPLAGEVLQALGGKTAIPTATGLAAALGVPQPQIERTLDLLQDAKVVEAVTIDASERGVTYRAICDPVFTDEEYAALDPADRRRLFAMALGQMEDRIWASVETGGFDGHDVHVSWLTSNLDEQGYEAMVALTAEVVERARDIQVDVAQRRADGTSDGGEVKTDLMLMHFLRTPGPLVPPADEADELRIEMYALSERIDQEIAKTSVDFRRIAALSLDLARLARRHAAL